ncbi:hypothetical protein ACLRGF_14440 [Mycetocola zhadangensis]|uniref:hypothetical protein n=1 Tax=Mycetocola zhadangensis TaxID=1164595 RepID=UPI003A4DFF17
MSRRTNRDPHDTDVPNSENPGEGTLANDVCGYRLIRVLERSATATTWLARPGGSTRREENPSNEQLHTTVALTRFDSEVGQPTVSPALFGVASPYLQYALDVGTDSSGRVIVITERTEGTLTELLAARHILRVGEIVTVLAPIASALHSLHTAGFSHGALSPAAVRFSQEGRPVLHLSSFGPDSPDPSVGRADDIRDLRELMAALVEKCAAPEKEDDVAALMRWYDRMTPDEMTDAFFSQLDLRLFALADPLPVDFESDTAEQDIFLLRGEHQPARRSVSAPSTMATGALRRLLETLDGVGVDKLGELLDRSTLASALTTQLAGLRAWLMRAIRGRAALLLVATATAVVAVLGGLALVPEAKSSARSGDTEIERAHTGPPEVTMTEAERTALASDDPFVGLEALFAVRSRCLQTGNPSCLSLVHELGSAAETTDEHVLGTHDEALLPGPVTRVDAELLQRTGDAALFRVNPAGHKENQPVLVLMMRTSTGWRVRDLAVPG